MGLSGIQASLRTTKGTHIYHGQIHEYKDKGEDMTGGEKRNGSTVSERVVSSGFCSYWRNLIEGTMVTDAHLKDH